MLEFSDEEQSWIARSRSGDHEAFEALMRRYQQMIHALAYRMTGSMTDAEDIAQETFIAAFEHLGSFHAESKFSTWLYRIAANRCVNWHNRERRRLHAYEKWMREMDSNLNDQPQADSFSQEIHSALLKLQPAQRAAIVLTTFDGLSHAEAADVLGCSETTVSWRIFVARRKLKTLLRPLAQGTEHD
jgi:RNA polymerase sigma-70 factor (ECF subfamily)